MFMLRVLSLLIVFAWVQARFAGPEAIVGGGGKGKARTLGARNAAQALVNWLGNQVISLRLIGVEEKMNAFSHVPPGFRFHPTDEELVDYYLRKKVAFEKIDLDIIKDVDLYKIEPWDLQEQCKIGREEQNGWYFFSHKDKKYPTGTRTNRATTAGFWKATGRDKPIYVKSRLVGMRKTLVFYKGRAPNGQKLDWIMHEYRLETNENAAPHEEGWVVCRVFKKRVATVQRMAAGSPFGFTDHSAFMATSPDGVDVDVWPRLAAHHHHQNAAAPYHGYHPCKVELEHHQLLPQEPGSFLQLPQLDSPDLIGHVALLQPCSLLPEHEQASPSRQLEVEPVYATDASAADWRDLDRFVASQLISSNGGSATKGCGCGYSNPVQAVQVQEKQEDALVDYVSTSASCAGENDLWK